MGGRAGCDHTIIDLPLTKEEENNNNNNDNRYRPLLLLSQLLKVRPLNAKLHSSSNLSTLGACLRVVVLSADDEIFSACDDILSSQWDLHRR